MISRTDPVFVFDLDETLLTCNSFPRWVRFMLKGPVPAPKPRRLLLTARVGIRLILRKLGRQSHRVFKGSLQRVWAQVLPGAAGGQAAERFATSLLPKVRPALHAWAMDLQAQGHDVVLATAAVEEYALPLARRLGFRHVLATPRGLAATAETVGAGKRDGTLRLLAERGWSGRPLVLATDSSDDLPLIAISARVLWYGAVAERQKVEAGHGSAVLLDCLAADPATLNRHVADLLTPAGQSVA